MATGNRLLVFYITAGGEKTGLSIKEHFPDAECLRFTKETLRDNWQSARACVFVMASGIVVRAVAPLIRDKQKDPAVLVLDEKGKHVVSLLGGHESGANRLAEEIARVLGARTVITTATDMSSLTPIDVFAGTNGLVIEPRELLPEISSRHLREGGLKVFPDCPIRLPDDYIRVNDISEADVVISFREMDKKALYLRPRTLVAGIGLNSGTEDREIETAVEKLFRKERLSIKSLGLIATHEKNKSEPGLRNVARRMGLRIVGFTTEELNAVCGVAHSEAARKALGVNAVAEPSALLASYSDKLLVGKVKSGNVALAIADSRAKRIRVVGTGPGGLEHITPSALSAIREAEIVVGYKAYLKLIEPLLFGKEVVSSGMTEEVIRVRAAVEAAQQGKRVCLVSGGDPGIYAMAGLVFEFIRSIGVCLDVDVMPGVSALNACASRLGAPLMHDFSAISLSDRLTPWGVIEKRLDAAASADFVIVLYNPKSKGRTTQIAKAGEIILRHRGGDTPVGIVKSAMRADEEVTITTLDKMLDHDIDMQSTVIVGNSRTFRWRDSMVTPRGYDTKYEM